MTKNTEFEARLARIQSRTKPTQPPGDATLAPNLRPAPRATLPMPVISTALGLSLMAGLVAYAWNDIAMLFPAQKDGRTVSYLESALSDRMSAADIERMNADPALEGMTEMQKMILSH